MSYAVVVRALATASALAAALLACRRTDSTPARGGASTAGISTGPPGLTRSREPQPDGAGDFIDQQMSMRVLQFAANLAPVMPLVRGTLPQGGSASHVFEMAAGHCYRVIAVGGVEVNDLDLTLFAPDATEVDSDTQRDNYPVIGRSRPVCPPNGGRYRLEVRMYDGQGEYGLQIFGTP